MISKMASQECLNKDSPIAMEQQRESNSSRRKLRSSQSRSKFNTRNGAEIQSFLTPKSERSSNINIRECEKKHSRRDHITTSMEKDVASPMKNSSSKRSLQMSVSPKNSRNSASLEKISRGSRTARNKDTSKGGFNFKLETTVVKEEEAELVDDNLKIITKSPLAKKPSTARFEKKNLFIAAGIEELPLQESPRLQNLKSNYDQQPSNSRKEDTTQGHEETADVLSFRTIGYTNGLSPNND